MMTGTLPALARARTTDILTEQSAIKARNRPIRDRSGQFIRPSAALAAKVTSDRMKARLERDTKADEHARGVVYEKGHFHALPGARLHSIESIPHTGERSDPLPSLFDERRVA